jgi:2-polyprenyl-6-methoxyphenol hydroxylase-like FAD-dependent oxidoreductase
MGPALNHTDVLIVGAGPTGLTLACDLARWGITCRIVDQGSGPQVGSRGFALKPRTLDVLDALGVAARVAQVAANHTPIRFHLGQPLLFDLSVPPARPTPQRPHPNALSLPQWRTEAILRDRLAELGGKVEFGCRLNGFRPDDDGVTVTLERDGATETVRAAYLVGADGGRSFVRRHLGLTFEGATNEDTRALLADVHVRGLAHPDAVHLWMGADGLLVIRPTPDPDTCQIVASLQPNVDGTWPDASLDNLQQMVDHRTGRTDIRLTAPTWLSLWRYNLRMVDRYRVGRVFLAGDAAHVHSPFGAYGMNTGIQDAYNIGWKLALTLRGAAGDSLLDTYQAERLPVARAVLADSDKRFSAATPPRLLRPALRLIIKTVMARQQHHDRDDYPTYHASSLSLDRSGRRNPVRAGDTAPDSPLGDSTRLFDLFRGTHFTVLTFGNRTVHTVDDNHVRAYKVVPANEPETAGAAAHVDTTGAAHRSYGARNGTLVVVRPDGYVGLIAHDPGPDTLRDYLGQIDLQLPTQPTIEGQLFDSS